LSLEQRKREIAIHRVLGGTEANLRGMVLLEVFIISTVGWFAGYTLSLLSVPLILDAVGFMSFRKGEFDVNAILSFWSTILVIILTIVVAMLFGRNRTREFLSMEIDEGVRKVVTAKKPRTWLHLTAFTVGVLAVLESWIETNEGWWIYGEGQHIFKDEATLEEYDLVFPNENMEELVELYLAVCEMEYFPMECEMKGTLNGNILTVQAFEILYIQGCGE